MWKGKQAKRASFNQSASLRNPPEKRFTSEDKSGLTTKKRKQFSRSKAIAIAIAIQGYSFPWPTPKKATDNF